MTQIISRLELEGVLRDNEELNSKKESLTKELENLNFNYTKNNDYALSILKNIYSKELEIWDKYLSKIVGKIKEVNVILDFVEKKDLQAATQLNSIYFNENKEEK